MSKSLVLAASTTLLMAGVVLAQETPGRQPGSQQNPTSQERDRSTFGQSGQQSGQETDAILVSWLLVDNENEVALARIAQQRATSSEVKQFAQKMIDEHQQMVQKLQQIPGVHRSGSEGMTGRESGTGREGNTGRESGTGRETGTGQSGSGQSGTNRNDPNRPGGMGETGRTSDATGVRVNATGSLDHQRLIRDLGRKHLESATQLLQEKQGADFDKCYMGMMLGAHMKAEDQIEVFRNYASEKLRPTLDEGLKTVQAHLQHAKDLAKRTDELASAGNIRNR